MNKILLSFFLLFILGCTSIQEERTSCKEEQRNVDFCITLYEPVCGDNSQTYSNSCNACKDESIKYWTEGECTK